MQGQICLSSLQTLDQTGFTGIYIQIKFADVQKFLDGRTGNNTKIDLEDRKSYLTPIHPWI